ncbi:MAG: hypothetical protein VYE18_07845 [Pseudomonadota bacterium]|nr:hypothetical protein [Pseudomonadota bacterium]
MKDESGRNIGLLTSNGDYSGLNAAIGALDQRLILGHSWPIAGILANSLETTARGLGICLAD